MPKLPYQKTTIRDLSQFTNIGDGSTGLNIGTVIAAKTGPMGRMTLTGFDDLINYYCTGTTITPTEDQSLQCVGALLNTTAVDVIRVGTSNIRVGKTDDNKIIYTDNDFNLIPTLSRITFKDRSEKPNTIAISTDDTEYYIGDEPTSVPADKELSNMGYQGNTYTIDEFIRTFVGIKSDILDIINYSNNSIEFQTPTEFYSTEYTKAAMTFNPAERLLTTINDKELTINDALIVDNVSFVYVGNGKSFTGDGFEEPIVKIKSSDPNEFLAELVANCDTLLTYNIQFNMQNVDDMSDNLKERLVNGKYQYSKNVSINRLWFAIDDNVYVYNNAELPEIYYETKAKIDPETGNIIENETEPLYNIINVIDSETDFVKIIKEIESEAEDNLLHVDTAKVYFGSSTILFTGDESTSPFDIVNLDNTNNGYYKLVLSPTEYMLETYWFFIDGYVYYCGSEKPTLGDNYEVIEYIKIDESKLRFDDFCEKLIAQLQADMIIGYVNLTTILVKGDINITKSSNLGVVKTIIEQSETIANSKFALVAKFPTTQKLFSYVFTRDSEITDYDIFDITWTYNQVNKTVSVGFDDNAVDGYGTMLYFDKYNDGEYSNDYFHIMQLNGFTKLDSNEKTTKYAIGNIISVDPFGNELLMPEPTATDYQTAILKFNDYEDKSYSFFWDAGYCSPILAKAMLQVADEKNAQIVPSFPPTYKTVEQILSYHDALGMQSTWRAVEVVPGHKGTYCGSFLTTVPGSLSYIVARVNSFNNVTVEFQPLFGPRRGAVSAPNLIWNINKVDQQRLADKNINSIIQNINGTYLNYNLTSQKLTSYLSEEQNVYMSNCIAHICEEYNPNIIAELNTPSLWANVINQLTQLISNRLQSGKNPTLNAFRVICDDKLNTQDVIEARQLKYKVEVQFTPSVSYCLAYIDVVRLNSF